MEFSSDPRFISTARLFAAAVARYFHCNEETVDDVKLAISEACTNAVKAHEGSTLPVGVVARPEDSRLEFEVTDRAGGFDLSQIKPPDTGADLVEGGIGLQIIRALFPEATVAPNPDGGTTVRFAVAVD